MHSQRIVYNQRPDATPAGEASALAQAYAYILKKLQEKQKGGSATAPNDAERIPSDGAKTILQD
jgi:hypothetical protein